MLRNALLENIPSQRNGIYLGKMTTKVGTYSATHESVTVPAGRDRKMRTAPTANQMTGFVTVLAEQKVKLSVDG